MLACRTNPYAVFKTLADRVREPDGDDCIGPAVAVFGDRGRIFTFHLITTERPQCLPSKV